MISYSDREVTDQLRAIQRGFKTLQLTAWEREFVNSVWGKDAPFLSDRQKKVITRIWEENLDVEPVESYP